MAPSPPEPADPDPVPGPSVDWLQCQQPRCGPTDLTPRQLAWLGDAVWELHQRLRHCHYPAPAIALHRAVVESVKASAQAAALRSLEPLLREQERAWVRRGRNGAGRGPRGAEPGDYGLATGFETMVGWLFLQDPQRLAQLLDQLEETTP